MKPTSEVVSVDMFFDEKGEPISFVMKHKPSGKVIQFKVEEMGVKDVVEAMIGGPTYLKNKIDHAPLPE